MNVIKKYRSFLFVFFSAVLYYILSYYADRTEYTSLVISWTFLFIFSYFLIKQKENSISFLIISAFIFRLIFISATPFLSQDFYRFIWDGRMILEGFNPYLSLPQSFIEQGNLPFFGASDLVEGMGELSANNYTNYPPLNQLCFLIGACLSNGNLLGNIMVLRIQILLADMGILFIGLKILKTLNLNPRAIFWYALNPFIIIEMTGNLHFEPVMLFFLLAGIYFIIAKRWLLSGLFLSFSIALKLVPLLLLPVFFRFIYKRLHVKHPIGKFLTSGLFYVFVIFVCLLLFLPFFSEDLINNYSNSVGLWFRKFEFNASFYYIFRQIGYWISGYNQIAIIGKIIPILSAIFILWLSFFRKNENVKVLLISLLFGISFYYFFSSTVHPWYVATPLLLAVFTNYRFPIVWSFLLILSYQVYASNPWKENLYLIGLEYIILYFFIYIELKHPSKRPII